MVDFNKAVSDRTQLQIATDTAAHAAADDEIILIEAERQRLAVEYFLLDEVLGQSRQFLPARRPHPDPGADGRAG